MVYEKLKTQTEPISMASLIELFDVALYDKPLNPSHLSNQLRKTKGHLLHVQTNELDKKNKGLLFSVLKK